MKILLHQILLISLISELLSLSPICKMCHELVGFIKSNMPQRPSRLFLNEVSTQYCVRKHLQSQKVCKQAVAEMVPSIQQSIWQHYSDPHLVCHKLLFCPKQYILRDLQKEIQEILKDKPQGKKWQTPKKQKVLKIMHMSDVHPDLFYTAGAPYKCSQPVCCRGNVTVTAQNIIKRMQEVDNHQFLTQQPSTQYPAGYWGSVADCDLPPQTLYRFMQQLQKYKDLDLIIWTGDNTPHDVWQQTQAYNINYTFWISQLLRKHTNVTIIPTMGNHESWPVNVYDFQGDRQYVLHAGMAQAWRHWLTDQAYKMMREKGFYSMVLPKLNNLKIISLNTQAANDMNWFLLRDPTDPGGMLKWIEQQLRQSEKLDQHVYIIGHIHPLSMLNDWSMRYNALVDRFSYIIRGQFFGHSHQDHIGFFTTFKDPEQLSGYYLLPPSVTTYSSNMPCYRVMEVDLQTNLVLNYEQFMMHIQKAPKKEDNPPFQHFYSFLQTYQIEDMMLEGGIKKLRNKLRDDPKTQVLYTYLMNRGLKPGESGRSVYCNTMTSRQLSNECMGKQAQKQKRDWFQMLAGPWKQLKHKL